MRTARAACTLAVLATMAVVVSCGGEPPAASGPAEPTGVVSGTIRGTQVTLANATFDGDLALYEEGGWGFSPSLLLFLFLDDSAAPEGREIVVGPDHDTPGATPHVHFRWRDPDSGELDVGSVTGDYRLRLSFGRVQDGELPGTIVLEIPGEETHVEGAFRATVED